ncbi:hypothetical protein N8Y26_25435, partial [Enterobacter hormaechei subsp. steigerwaltii]|nr:hypothetical protein [Enterobacter hormaechei subsp. steigerwaltii]
APVPVNGSDIKPPLIAVDPLRKVEGKQKRPPKGSLRKKLEYGQVYLDLRHLIQQTHPRLIGF